MDTLLVILYALLWGVTFYYFRKKSSYFGAGSFIMLMNLVYAIFSFFYLGNMDELFSVKDFTVFPFLYLFISIIVVSSPVFKYEIKNVEKLHRPNLFLIDSFSIVYILCTILVIPTIFSNIFTGLALIFMNANGGVELYDLNLYNSSMSRGSDGGVGNLLVLFYGFFTDISIFVFFYYFTIKKPRFWIKLGLGLCTIVSTLRWVSIGTRTGVMTNVLTMVIAYLLLSKYMNSNIKSLAKKILIVASIIIMVPVIALTISRKGNTALESLSVYFGQANLHFNKYGLDAGGIRHGDRTIGYFKYMLKVNPHFIDGRELRERYSNMDIDDGHFYTFIGDFTLDFGPYVAALIFVMFALGMNYIIKYRHKEILYHHLILVYFTACVVVQGGMYLFTYSLTGNGTIIAFVLFYLLFKFDYIVQKNKERTFFKKKVAAQKICQQM